MLYNDKLVPKELERRVNDMKYLYYVEKEGIQKELLPKCLVFVLGLIWIGVILFNASLPDELTGSLLIGIILNVLILFFYFIIVFEMMDARYRTHKFQILNQLDIPIEESVELKDTPTEHKY